MITPVPTVSETETPYCEIGNLPPSGGREVKNGADDPAETLTDAADLRQTHAKRHVDRLDAYGDDEEKAAFYEGLRIFDDALRDALADGRD